MHVIRVPVGLEEVIGLAEGARAAHFVIILSDNILLFIIFIIHALHGELASDGGVVFSLLLTQRGVNGA